MSFGAYSSELLTDARMSKKLFPVFFGIFIFFGIPGFGLITKASGECFTAADFGTTSVNGTYTDTGTTQAGKPVYNNATGGWYVEYSGSGGYEWAIANNVGNPPTTPYYYTWPNDGSSSIPSDLVVGDWTVRTDNGATAPAGTFTLITCPGGGSGTTTTSTAISVDQAPSYYFYGIAIFFIAFITAKRIL